MGAAVTRGLVARTQWRPGAVLVGVAVIAVASLWAIPAFAAPIWNIQSEAMPTAFQPSDGTGDDAYYITLENIGDVGSSGPVRVVDHLPAGITTSAPPQTLQTEQTGAGEGQWSCGGGAGQSVVTCSLVSPGGPPTMVPITSLYDDSEFQTSQAVVARIEVPVQVAPATAGHLENYVTVEGGGAPSATVSITNPVDLGPSTFGTAFMGFRAVNESSDTSMQAGGHPWALTTAFQFNQKLSADAVHAASNEFLYENAARTEEAVTEEAKTIIAELPLGLLGDTLATPRCAQREFSEPAPTGTVRTGSNISACPSDTRVGVASLQIPGFGPGYQLDSLVPISGHAAEFGFHYEGAPFVFFGDVAKTSRGYVLRITSPTPQANVRAVYLTFFGDPAAAFETNEKETAFLTNPVDCNASEEQRTLELHMDTWTHPGTGDPFNANFSDPNWIPANATLPPVEGCGALTFNPSLSFQPASEAEGGTTQADSPSGYNVNLEVPQNEEYSKLATPEIKTTKVTLPAGLSVSPSAANGLEACSNEQIDLESNGPGSCPLGSQSRYREGHDPPAGRSGGRRGLPWSAGMR